MMDFMSHLIESMLCKAMRRSPGVSGDTEELPSPAKYKKVKSQSTTGGRRDRKVMKGSYCAESPAAC